MTEYHKDHKEKEATELPVNYIERTNMALDHVVRNHDSHLSLDEVAQVDGFSPHHFHRVFRRIVAKHLVSLLSAYASNVRSI